MSLALFQLVLTESDKLWGVNHCFERSYVSCTCQFTTLWCAVMPPITFCIILILAHLGVVRSA